MSSFSRVQPRLGERLLQLNWGMILLVVATATVGFAMLYSAAGGNLDPWASRQAVRFAFGFGAMLVFTVPLAVGLVYEWMKGGLEW